MTTFHRWMDKLPWGLLIVAALTLGLSPFFPEPHLWEKLKMLVAGDLVKPIDWFDLVLHGTPYVLLLLKLLAQLLPKPKV
ncbi:MAG: RND transporter [Thiofilum sp.]|uniref:RND transporter n=1 Tax=Thiofilum sp. TaxID=2212733 RepID=UPI0025F2B1DF|nr:RND transporter [Thiofilum sp.]MBK8454434.1 RND transporter [Thiofilum sp.]